MKRTPPPPTRRRRRNITREYETNRTRDHHFTAGFCLAFWAPPRLAAAAASVGSSDPTSPIGRSCQWPPNLTLVLTLVVIGDVHGAGEAMSGSVGRRTSPAAVRHGGVRAPPRSDKVRGSPLAFLPPTPLPFLGSGRRKVCANDDIPRVFLCCFQYVFFFSFCVCLLPSLTLACSSDRNKAAAFRVPWEMGA